jgi:hypothetical protein
MLNSVNFHLFRLIIIFFLSLGLSSLLVELLANGLKVDGTTAAIVYKF